MDTYKTGNGPHEIFFKLDVTSIGLCASRAIIGIPGGAQPPQSVATSVGVTGDINRSKIGVASTVMGKLFSITTSIDLNGIADQQARETECNRISSVVVLDNGSDGNKEFKNTGYKVIKDNFTKVYITTNINLIES